MLTSFVNMVLCYREDFTTGTPVAFRSRQYALTTAMGGNFILRTWHSCSFLLLFMFL
jgi:hypothetical protein